MTRTEARAKCIEAMAKAIFKRLFPSAPVDEHFAWYYRWEESPQSAVHYSNVATAILDATAAFDSLHGIARVNLPEATDIMVACGEAEEPDVNVGFRFIWLAMSGAGDLTNRPDSR